MNDESKCASDECLKLEKELGPRAKKLWQLVANDLWPASSTPKRKAATMRLLNALSGITLANRELFEALADVEDAV